MSSFQIEIITPKETFPARNIVSINLPTDDGRITVLANHQSLICSLTKGETLIVTENNKEETWLTDQGVITVEKNKAELLTRSAEELMQEDNEG